MIKNKPKFKVFDKVKYVCGYSHDSHSVAHVLIRIESADEEAIDEINEGDYFYILHPSNHYVREYRIEKITEDKDAKD